MGKKMHIKKKKSCDMEENKIKRCDDDAEDTSPDNQSNDAVYS